jgi:hypothetical protein
MPVIKMGVFRGGNYEKREIVIVITPPHIKTPDR